MKDELEKELVKDLKERKQIEKSNYKHESEKKISQKPLFLKNPKALAFILSTILLIVEEVILLIDHTILSPIMWILIIVLSFAIFLMSGGISQRDEQGNTKEDD